VGLGKGREKEDPLVTPKQTRRHRRLPRKKQKVFVRTPFFSVRTPTYNGSPFSVDPTKRSTRKKRTPDFPTRAYEERNVCQLASDDDGADPTNDAMPERPATPKREAKIKN